jgi:hypothetical protein
MMRDHWWWPWWVSSLIDVGVVIAAVIVYCLSSRRAVRAVAAVFALAALVAAVAAPIVMTDRGNHPKDEAPMMP